MLRRYFDPRSRDLLVPAPLDDAAVWRGDPFVVATVDTLVEGIDFRLDWPGFTFEMLGRRLMAVNLSDLAAMGAQPRHALVSLCLRPQMAAADITALYRGVAQQARRFRCTIAGGDLSGTTGPIMATVTLIGRVAAATAILRRTGARPGWQIGVTGSLGGAAAGLRLLEARRAPASRLERQWVKAQLDPEPRVEAGQALVTSGIRVGGDISDGLIREIERLVESDRLGATIDLDRLPLAPGLDRDQWKLGLVDAEDFELVCAAPTARMASAQRALRRLAIPLTVIGAIDGRRGIRLKRGTGLTTIGHGGYQHFR
jgi:thiamine-monophosphate kinase